MNDQNDSDFTTQIIATTRILEPKEILTDNQKTHLLELQKQVNRLLASQGAFGTGTIPHKTDTGTDGFDPMARLKKEDM